MMPSVILAYGFSWFPYSSCSMAKYRSDKRICSKSTEKAFLVRTESTISTYRFPTKDPGTLLNRLYVFSDTVFS
jgi:hypothetical protein